MANLTKTIGGLIAVFLLTIGYYPMNLQEVAFIRDSLLFRLALMVPSQCPFERKIDFMGIHAKIPALCKINPLFEKIEELRYKAVCFAVDKLGIPYEQLV